MKRALTTPAQNAAAPIPKPIAAGGVLASWIATPVMMAAITIVEQKSTKFQNHDRQDCFMLEFPKFVER
jgi:hypothetical protein